MFWPDTWLTAFSCIRTGSFEASEKVMNEILFPDGILLQYSWAPFFARSILVPAIEWLVSSTIIWWKPLASTCFSATSVILKTASTLESYEYGWLISVLTDIVIL